MRKRTSDEKKKPHTQNCILLCYEYRIELEEVTYLLGLIEGNLSDIQDYQVSSAVEFEYCRSTYNYTLMRFLQIFPLVLRCWYILILFD